MSHTAVMLAAGFGLLVLLWLVIRDTTRATRLFLLLWFVVSIGNLLVGVFHAGYGWAEEATIWLFVFGAPAVLAFAASRFGC